MFQFPWLVALRAVLGQSSGSGRRFRRRARNSPLPGLVESLESRTVLTRVLYISDSFTTLCTLDPATGAVQVVGDMGVTMHDIAFAPDGTLYGLADDALYSIDPATASVSRIGGNLDPAVVGLTVSASGTIYAAGSDLYTLNPINGLDTDLGPIGFDCAGDIEFDAAGNLYMSDVFGDLIHLNSLTGAGTDVGSMGFDSVFGMAFNDGVMYGFDSFNEQVFTINLSTGAGTALSDFSNQGADGVFGASFQPELHRVDLSIQADSANLPEGDSNFTTFTFTVTRTGDLSTSTSVNYNVVGSTGAPADGADFGGALPSGTITFQPNQATANITVDVTGDTQQEPDEGFNVVLSNASIGALITTDTASGKIQNDDFSVVSLAATSAVKPEGNGGITPFTFTVTRSGSTTGTTTVNYAVTGDGASPANAADFGAASLPAGTVTFMPNETSKTITIGVQGDAQLESDESFRVTISNASGGASIIVNSAVGTIQNDDLANLNLTSTTGTRAEGNSGFTPFTFTVTRTGSVFGATTVDYVVTGSGTNPADATDFGGSFPSGTVSFASNDITETITINVAGDALFEFAEGFTVTLSNPSGGALIVTGTADGTILNDDLATLAIASSSGSQPEGNAGNTPFIFTVTRSGSINGSTTVNYAVTGDGLTPADATDFGGTFPSGTVTFGPNETTKAITINIQGDILLEPDEGFRVTLSNPTDGALLSPNSATATIQNDDANQPPTNIALNPSSIAENNAANATVGTLTATDPDTGNTFTFTLVPGTGSTDNGSFTIVGNTLQIAPSANFEAKNSYSVRIRVTDQDHASFEKAFTVTITNVNESPTNITLSPNAVAENSAANTAVGTLTATDPDAGGTFTFSLVDGLGSTDNASFQIVGTTLQIIPSADFESQSSYSIRIRVTDQGGLSFEKPLTVDVTDVNEAPTDLNLSATTIAENNAANATVGTFTATDPDTGNTFNFSLVDGAGSTDNSDFNIVGNALKLIPSANFEAQSSYSIRVRVADQGGASFQKQFTISVTNVNESPTNIGLTPSNIAENNAPDSVVGTLTTSDPDAGNTFTYSLVDGAGSTDNSSFSVVGNSLHIIPTTDFESKASYSIRLQVTDQGGASFEKPFTVSVTDFNEAPSSLTLSGSTIAENNAANATIGTFSATDPDAGNTFTYSLVAGEGAADNGRFNIAGNVLQLVAAANFEAQNVYEIRVRVSDQGGVFLEKEFTINVTDVNEPPTNITLTGANVQENNAPNATIGSLSAIDPDAGNTFTFSLVPGTGSNDNDKFNIVNNQLQIVSAADYEAQSSYAIRIRVSDQGQATFDKQFTINVSDVNEAPTISSVTEQIVLEDTPSNSIPITIKDSETPSDDLEISITSSNPSLISDTNIVLGGTGSERTLVLTPTANKNGVTVITVTASDGTMTTTREFNVTVTAVDDPPVITLTPQPLVLTSGKPTAIDRNATLTDIDTPNLALDGAILHISGQGAKDKLRILKLDGIHRKGKTVASGAAIIGTLSGGIKGAPLEIHLNSSATQDNVQSLLRAIGIKLVGSTDPRAMHIQITNISGIDTNEAVRQVQRGG